MSASNPVTGDTIKALYASKHIKTKSYKRQCVWNNKMARLLSAKYKPWKGFSFMPKGEVS